MEFASAESQLTATCYDSAGKEKFMRIRNKPLSKIQCGRSEAVSVGIGWVFRGLIVVGILWTLICFAIGRPDSLIALAMTGVASFAFTPFLLIVGMVVGSVAHRVFSIRLFP